MSFLHSPSFTHCDVLGYASTLFLSYNTKNYTEQGGEKNVIGGELEFTADASVTGLPVASASKTGGVKASAKSAGDTVEAKVGTDGKLYVPTYPVVPTFPIAANQVASTEETYPTVTEFNALLAKLKAAGLMVADE